MAFKVFPNTLHDVPSGPPAHCWSVANRRFRSRFEREKSTCSYKHKRTVVCCWFCLFKQKYLLSNPAHQSSAVDEHFFLNESAAQVRYAWLWCWRVPDVSIDSENDFQPLPPRDITKFKPLSSKTSVTVITGDRFDHEMSDQLNQVRRRQPRTVVCVETLSNPPPPLPRAPDGSCTSNEVFGGVLPISQSHSHNRSRPANDPHAAICRHPAAEEAGEAAPGQPAEPVMQGQRAPAPQTEQSARMSAISRK